MANLRLVVIRLLAFVGLLSSTVSGGAADHTYKNGEHVELWVNKVCFYDRSRTS